MTCETLGPFEARVLENWSIEFIWPFMGKGSTITRLSLVIFFPCDFSLILAQAQYICRTHFICYLLETNFPGKVNYFLIFDSIMRNKLENTFWYFIMSYKINWKITYQYFIFFKFIKIIRNKSYKLKIWMKIKLKKYI